ncbi:MAG: bifunctional oligoribonuclease/PAP phosphatase NrnA [Eubacteriales bacterium]|nr:bifunctional oligoribonuclease/PAP phosphatase NrnA [Eubacteriales bacterium]
MGIGAAARFLRENDNFLLIAHVSPDGDTLGSCLALYDALDHMGKKVQIACEEPVPPSLQFLHNSEVVVNDGGVKPFDSVIYVDCADIQRVGTLESITLLAKNSFCIDHHETNKGYAQGNLIEPCAATGEIVFAILKELGIEINRDIATCLFAAISTDTGNFAYSSTTPRTFEIAAELLKTGFDLPDINRRLFRTKRLQKAQLMGLLMTRLELYEQNKFAISHIYYEELTQLYATSADCEGLIDYIRDIDTVEVACFVRESSSGAIRVSMRSKYDFDVSAISVMFGGGGHQNAAGCTMECTMDEALNKLKDAVIGRMHG